MPVNSGMSPVGEVEHLAGVEKVFKEWQLYSKVVQNNYLYHREVYARLHHFLSDRVAQAFTLLDLGCGDAGCMAQALAGTAVRRYLGVDLSQMALDLAARNLALLRCEYQLQEKDYYEVVREGGIKAEVIWLGLTFHHLPLTQKANFLHGARKILPSGGYLLMFEPTLLEDEDREQFLERTAQIRQNAWREMTAVELETIREHTDNYDFPEKISTLEQMGREQGFSGLTPMFQNPDQVYTLMCLPA